MQVLGKILKVLLCLALLALVLGLLTALAWWMHWPLATGAVILLGLLALAVLIIAVRAGVRWSNKKLFIRKVLDEQQAVTMSAPAIGGMADAWRQGMQIMATSPARFHQTLRFSQPWFLTLTLDGGPSLFQGAGKTVPADDNAPLHWHFLRSSVALECAAPEGDAQDWSTLLELAARQRGGCPFRGLVLVVSARTLRETGEDILPARGMNLANIVQQFLLSRRRSCPVFVLVRDLETLPGMDALTRLLPPAMLESSPGLVLQNPEEELPHVAEEVARLLERGLQEQAVDGMPPRGDALRALCELRDLGPRLTRLLSPLCTPVVHQAFSPLRGVHFCFGAPLPDRGGQPPFVLPYFSDVLPMQGYSRPLGGSLPFFASTRLWMLGAWLLITLFVCGLLTANTVYQRNVLQLPPPRTESISHDERIQKLYAEMLYALQLEKARKNWLLPTLGLNMLERAEQHCKLRFVEQTYAAVMAPLRSRLLHQLNQPVTEQNKAQARDSALLIGWLCDVISEKLRTGTVEEKKRMEVFPVIGNYEDWNMISAQLYLFALDWMPGGEMQDALAAGVRSLLDRAVSRDNASLLDDVEQGVNAGMPAARICLSHFWTETPLGGEKEMCIPPVYTARGHAVVEDALEDILTIGGNSPGMRQNIEAYRHEYLRRYERAWREFATAFGQGWSNLQQSEIFAAMGAEGSAASLPHVRLLRRMGSELLPLARQAKATGTSLSPWVQDALLLQVLCDIALADPQSETPQAWRGILSLSLESPELLAALRDVTRDMEHLRQSLEAAMALRHYLGHCTELLRVMASQGRSLTLAQEHFANAKDAPTESPYTGAREAVKAVVQPLAAPHGAGRLLLADLLDCLRQGITVQAAAAVQHKWENEVLSSPAALYEGSNLEALYGKDGVVTRFLSQTLTPLFRRQDAAPAAAFWDGTPFPFTADFLSAISRAEAVAAVPPRDAYDVLLRSQPTILNREATQRPDSTEFYLQCTDAPQRLLNNNYPRSARIHYAPAQCAAAGIILRFPDFEARYVYPDFIAFLRDFQYGERTFTPGDFPDAAQKLAAISANSLTVRLLPDNSAAILEAKDNEPATLPERIVYTW